MHHEEPNIRGFELVVLYKTSLYPGPYLYCLHNDIPHNLGPLAIRQN
jgi:hypothetical protein